MLTFKVTLNEKEQWTIGVPDKGVAAVQVLFARRDIKKTRKKYEELSLSLGGLEEVSANVHDSLTWAIKSLAIGDRIVIDVTSSNECDLAPERRREIHKRPKKK